jgi:hypothetical protein
MTGSFEVGGDKRINVKVVVDDSTPALSRALAQAHQLISQNKKAEARTVLQQAMALYKQAPLADEARKLLQEIDVNKK